MKQIEMRYSTNGILQYREKPSVYACRLMVEEWRDIPSESINNDWLCDVTMEQAHEALKKANACRKCGLNIPAK